MPDNRLSNELNELRTFAILHAIAMPIAVDIDIDGIFSGTPKQETKMNIQSKLASIKDAWAWLKWAIQDTIASWGFGGAENRKEWNKPDNGRIFDRGHKKGK